MEINPWHVDSIDAFYFLKCPECTFHTQKETKFQEHATKNHPLSFVLFGKEEIDDSLDILFGQEEIQDEKSNEDNLLTSIALKILRIVLVQGEA